MIYCLWHTISFIHLKIFYKPHADSHLIHRYNNIVMHDCVVNLLHISAGNMRINATLYKFRIATLADQDT